ncbi:MAG: alkaline phosphatase D family protein [Aeromicrobium erythreum]
MAARRPSRGRSPPTPGSPTWSAPARSARSPPGTTASRSTRPVCSPRRPTTTGSRAVPTSRRSAGPGPPPRSAARPSGCGSGSCRAPTGRPATSAPTATWPTPTSTSSSTSATTCTSTSRASTPTATSSRTSASTTRKRETITLRDYRRRHAQYKTDPDLQALHATVPFVVTWDDHEVADGWWPGGAFEHQPDEGSWDSRRRAALKAYDEWMPVRISGTARPGDGTRIYRSLRFGDLADLTMLDLRGYRDERVDVGSAALTDARRSITGRPQGEWLVEQLTTSTARWKLVGNPVMIAPMLMPQRPQAEQIALQHTTDPMAWGPAEPNTDTWDGYPEERRALLETIAEQDVQDVVFLSGDVHTAWANEVRLDDRPVATELVCASITSNNVDDFMGTPPRTVSRSIESAVRTLNPHVRFVNLDDHGFSVVELDRDRARLEWHAVSDRRDPDATSRLLAAREVRSGSARLLPA